MIINYDNNSVFYNVENPLGNRAVIPKAGGLYLIGNTIFNPLTNEQFFLVKVGMSTNLYDRMKNYSTSNPMMFHIAYKVINDGTDYSKQPSYSRRNAQGKYIKSIEEKYHKAMEAHRFCHFEYAQEWFLVSKETYMEICEKKFDFFEIED
jgi:hypothetical protein